MTLSPLPADLSDLYQHMGVEALGRHLEALTAALEAAGVEITGRSRVGLDEIAECIVEHHARHNPAALERVLVAAGDTPSARRPPAA